MIRNPLYHWTHLELTRYFNLSTLLSQTTAHKIYERINPQATSAAFSSQSLLEKMNVESICTTDDPLDNLEYHKKFAEKKGSTLMSSSFRPDKSILIQASEFNKYIDKLGVLCSIEINGFEDLCLALEKRMNYFHRHGCKLSDHGLEYIPFQKAPMSEIERIFKKTKNRSKTRTY